MSQKFEILNSEFRKYLTLNKPSIPKMIFEIKFLQFFIFAFFCDTSISFYEDLKGLQKSITYDTGFHPIFIKTVNFNISIKTFKPIYTMEGAGFHYIFSFVLNI